MFALQPEMKVFSGSANRELAQRICNYIGVPLAQADISAFPDGETYVKIEENIRGRDVFIIQPTCPPTNDHLMELLIMVDAARRASADRITAVIPFFGYARQDRKDKPRVPITAKLIANLLVAAGVHRVLTMDLHAQQVQGFFDIPVDHLYSMPGIDQISSAKINAANRDRVAGRGWIEDGIGLLAGARRGPGDRGETTQERH